MLSRAKAVVAFVGILVFVGIGLAVYTDFWQFGPFGLVMGASTGPIAATSGSTLASGSSMWLAGPVVCFTMLTVAAIRHWRNR